MRGLNTGAFSPAGARVNRGQCGRFGNAFAIFLQGGGNVNLDLTDVNGRFDVRCLDINTGQISSLGNVTGGGVRTIISGTTARRVHSGGSGCTTVGRRAGDPAERVCFPADW